MTPADLHDLRDLLERARYDLEQGWSEAAYDCLGRALRLLAEANGEECRATG